MFGRTGPRVSEPDGRRYQLLECRVPQLVHVQWVPAMTGGFTKLPHEHFTYSFRHPEHRYRFVAFCSSAVTFLQRGQLNPETSTRRRSL
jgi:hypothetical protein